VFDVLVLGEEQKCDIGAVYPVKFIGGLLMGLEYGLHDWTLLAVRAGDTRRLDDFHAEIDKAKDYYSRYQLDQQSLRHEVHAVIDDKHAVFVANELHKEWSEALEAAQAMEDEWGDEDEWGGRVYDM
jgi:hypothetical protein